jgi:hypothetical protein
MTNQKSLDKQDVTLKTKKPNKSKKDVRDKWHQEYGISKELAQLKGYSEPSLSKIITNMWEYGLGNINWKETKNKFDKRFKNYIEKL